MEYFEERLAFKIKKVLRYIRLYGARRTLVKIRSQYHMKKKYAVLPGIPSPLSKGGHIGLVGCGNFAFSNIAYYLTKNYGNVIRGAMDIDLNKAASLYKSYHLKYYTNNIYDILDDKEIDLVYVASNHASHAEYAILALEAGKSVHIEKPHVVSEEQLKRLCDAMRDYEGKVWLGFNRPTSRLGLAIKEYLDAQSGSAMFNWFVAGHELVPDHWYFNKNEGGRILGNVCHWTDFILQLIAPEDRYPILINPTRGTDRDQNVAVTFTFGDESIAAIVFSAKGNAFEGVRERFVAHRGDALILMMDFSSLVVHIKDWKYETTPLFRDQGHESNIKRSYEMVDTELTPSLPGCSVQYVWETGNLFLKTREALEKNQQVYIDSADQYQVSEIIRVSMTSDRS